VTRLAPLAIFLVLVAACERARPPGPPPTPAPTPAWLDETLGCVVRSTIEHANASRSPIQVGFMAVDVGQRDVDRTITRRFVEAMVDAAVATGPGGLRETPVAMFAAGAVAMAELGDLRAGRAMADRAVSGLDALPAEDRDYPRQRAIEVIAWSGDADRARSLAADRPMDNLAMAIGMARAGDPAGARRVLASMPSPAGGPDAEIAGYAAMAHVWAGDLPGARALLDAERDPDRRAMMIVWIAEIAARSRHPDRDRFIDDAIAEVKPRALTERDDAALAATVWNELVRFRDQVGGSSAARIELHDWMIGGQPGTLRRDMVGLNVIRAELAGLPSEADRLLAATMPPGTVRAGLDLAAARGQFDRALDLLVEHRRERAPVRSQDGGLPSGVIDAIDAAEVGLWLWFADTPRDDLIVARFRSVVCR
jgi:hypothetical protein